MVPRGQFPELPAPEQPFRERTLRMGRGSRFELWARVAQIKDQECLAP